MLLAAVRPIVTAFSASDSTWVRPQGLTADHNDNFKERLTTPAAGAGQQPHILMVLFDDFGFANAGWHRNYTGPGGAFIPATDEVSTPHLDALVTQGIDLDRAYTYKYCSPSRSAFQSGRNPYHVNGLNAEPDVSNPSDPVSGFAGIPRNMTGIATKLAAAGYRTAAFGKWDVGMASRDHTPRGRGYHESMVYFHHANDYWSMVDGPACKVEVSSREAVTSSASSVSIVDLWRSDGSGCEGPALEHCSSCVVPNPDPNPNPNPSPSPTGSRRLRCNTTAPPVTNPNPNPNPNPYPNPNPNPNRCEGPALQYNKSCVTPNLTLT